MVQVMLLLFRVRRLLAGYPELVAVLAAAGLGLTLQPPLAWAASHQGINVLRAVLVFATAVTIEPTALRRLLSTWRRLLIALAAGVIVPPVLAWAVAQMVAAGPLRDGIMTIGLAPCEIASVATTALAAGEAALSAGILIGSTLITVAAAGPILALEAGHASIHPGRIIANLALVVGLPLAAGIALRARAGLNAHTERAATTTGVMAVAALVALIAAEVHLSACYLVVALALLVFLVGSALTGWLLGRGTARPAAIAVLLTASMRDFAIAAGLAASAFGTAAAAPLGLYGILVLVWGTAVAGFLRRRHLAQGQGVPSAQARRRGHPEAPGSRRRSRTWPR
jgi:bile acid:Na+ symporter, BASS family